MQGQPGRCRSGRRWRSRFRSSEGRKYDVVSDKRGGVTLEPTITKTVAEIHAEHGERQLTSEEFEELFGEIPSDEEG